MKTISTAEVRSETERFLGLVAAEKETFVIEDGGVPRALVVPLDGATAQPDLSLLSFDRNRTLMQGTERRLGLGFWEWDELEDRCIYCSKEMAALHGVSVEDYLQRTSSTQKDLAWVHSDDRARVAAAAKAALDAKQGFDLDYRLCRDDGSVIEVREMMEPVLDYDGRLVRSVGFVQEISARKKAEEDLKQSEALLRHAAEMANIGYWVWDEISDRCIYASDTLAALVGMSVDEYMDRFTTIDQLVENVHPDDRDHFEKVITDAKARGAPYDIEFRERGAGGKYCYSRERGEPVFDANGLHTRTIGILQDVSEYKEIAVSLQKAQAELERRVEARTAELSASNAALRREIAERRQAEQALKESEGRFRSVAENSLAGVTFKDKEGRYELVNPQFELWYGVSEAEMLGRTVHDIFPKARAEEFAAWDQVVMQTGRGKVSESEVEFADGSRHVIRVSKVPFFDAEQSPAGICTVHVDLTRQRLAEEKLRQAQKLEAIGQLTGGVAHDFNNLLSVILGNIELAASRMDREDKALQAAVRAALRGAELTRQLLAYSRIQPLQPTAIDLEEVARHMSQLLRRTLGKEIEIVTLTEPGLWRAMADLGQVETALLNLAINARDAMPNGGTLTLEMENVHLDGSTGLGDSDDEPLKGDFVVLAVSDTGSGMNPDVQARAFEPFFTTKDVGEGSGMGLSMVYGFARQSGGQVSLESTPGRGSTLRLYLPRSEEVSAAAPPTSDDEEPLAAGEQVLLVEDDASVLDVTRTLLESLGYGVVQASDAESALKQLSSGRRIDLLLSDVMLPGGMNGPELAEAAAARRPDLKVLFMSGYPSNAIPPSGLFGAAPSLLRKPFLRSELAHALRALLDKTVRTAD